MRIFYCSLDGSNSSANSVHAVNFISGAYKVSGTWVTLARETTATLSLVLRQTVLHSLNKLLDPTLPQRVRPGCSQTIFYRNTRVEIDFGHGPSTSWDWVDVVGAIGVIANYAAGPGSEGNKYAWNLQVARKTVAFKPFNIRAGRVDRVYTWVPNLQRHTLAGDLYSEEPLLGEELLPLIQTMQERYEQNARTQTVVALDQHTLVFKGNVRFEIDLVRPSFGRPPTYGELVDALKDLLTYYQPVTRRRPMSLVGCIHKSGLCTHDSAGWGIITVSMQQNLNPYRVSTSNTTDPSNGTQPISHPITSIVATS